MLPRQTEPFGEDVAPGIGAPAAFDCVVRTQRGHRVGERGAEAGEVAAHRFQRLVERQRRGIALGEQCGVRGVVHELRFGGQLAGTGLVVGVVSGVPRQRRRDLRPLPAGVVDDEVLEDLVDHVDVGQRRVRVLARERQLLQVGSLAEQHLLWVRTAGDVHVEEHQQVNEVGGRAEERSALVAAAVVQRTEQRLEGRVRKHAGVPGGARSARRGIEQHGRVAQRGRRARGGVAQRQIGHGAVHLHRLRVDELGGLRAAELVGESHQERAMVHRDDLVRRPDAGGEKSRERRVVGGDLVETLQPLHLGHGRVVNLVTQVVPGDVSRDGLSTDLERTLIRVEEFDHLVAYVVARVQLRRTGLDHRREGRGRVALP